jgi:hypothetical protein
MTIFSQISIKLSWSNKKWKFEQKEAKTFIVVLNFVRVVLQYESDLKCFSRTVIALYRRRKLFFVRRWRDAWISQSNENRENKNERSGENYSVVFSNSSKKHLKSKWSGEKSDIVKFKLATIMKIRWQWSSCHRVLAGGRISQKQKE